MDTQLTTLPTPPSIALDMDWYNEASQWFRTLKEGTQRDYTRIFKLFFKSYQVLNDDTLTAYIASRQHLAMKTVQLEKGALTALAERCGRPISSDCARRLNLSIKEAVQQGQMAKPRKKEALWVDDIKAMVKLSLPTEKIVKGEVVPIKFAEECTIRNRALIAVTWVAGFRIDETINLTMDDISLKPGKVVITLRDWKTQQFDEDDFERTITGDYVFELLTKHKQNIMKRHEGKGDLGSYPLFFDFRKHSPEPISYNSARVIVRDYAKRVGHEGDISTHSLRAGHINQAILEGATRDEIGRGTRQTPATVAAYERNHETFNTSHISTVLD